MTEGSAYNYDNPLGLQRFRNGRSPSKPYLDIVVEGGIGGYIRKRKYATDYREHVENSSRLILDAASTVPKGGNVLVLGLGNAMEIPLIPLLDQFDSITAVDIDEPALTRTFNALPSDLQRKVKPVVDDISGMSADFCDIAMHALENTTSHDAFFNKFGEAIGKFPPPQTDFGHDYQLVISSLVLSQLVHYPIGYIDKMVKRKYSNYSRPSTESEVWLVRSLDRLIQRVDKQHMELLAKSVSAKGQVYFSDHTDAYSVDTDHNNQNIFRQLHNQEKDIVALEDCMNENFVIEKWREWMWIQVPPHAEQEEGSAFKIRGYSLAPVKER